MGEFHKPIKQETVDSSRSPSDLNGDKKRTRLKANQYGSATGMVFSQEINVRE